MGIESIIPAGLGIIFAAGEISIKNWFTESDAADRLLKLGSDPSKKLSDEIIDAEIREARKEVRKNVRINREGGNISLIAGLAVLGVSLYTDQDGWSVMSSAYLAVKTAHWLGLFNIGKQK